MEAQEVFNQVVNHLRQQKEKSILADDNTCAYYGTYGKKCAVGCLIKDAEYNGDMERRDVLGMLNFAKLIGRTELYDRLHPHVSLLRKLQDTHDNFRPDEWERRFKEVATEEGLTVPEP